MIDEILKNYRQSQAHIDSLNQVRFMLKNGTISSEELAIMALDHMGVKGELVEQVRSRAKIQRDKFLAEMMGTINSAVGACHESGRA